VKTGAQHHQSLGKYKSNPNRIHTLGWLQWKRGNKLGEGVEKLVGTEMVQSLGKFPKH
jgi:hypothetical protein